MKRSSSGPVVHGGEYRASSWRGRHGCSDDAKINSVWRVVGEGRRAGAARAAEYL